jgi:hypothetical protein
MLEQKFAAHETTMRQRLDRLESTMTTLSDKVGSEALDKRLSNLESLLGQLLAKMAQAEPAQV